ncbi:MAG: hypothetical protein WAK40_02530 [Thermoplasmata archaeon]
MIALLPANIGSIDLTAHPTPIALEDAAGAAPDPSFYLDRFLVPVGIVTVVFLGLTLMLAVGGWLGGMPLAMVLASSGAIFAVTIAVTRDRSRTGIAPSPNPSAPSTPSTGVESAFVCATCSEYTPPPDWEALLRESGPTGDLGSVGPGRGGPAPFLPVGVARAYSSVSYEPGTMPVGEFLRAPETVYIPPPASRALSDLFDGAEVILHEGRIVPIPLEFARSARSGAWRLPTHPVPVTTGSRSAPSVPARERELRSLPTTEEAPNELELLAAGDRPALDLWILSEVEGLVGRSASVGAMATLDAVRAAALALEADPRSTRATPSCAACRSSVTDSAIAHECTDCLRPICEPCRGRVVQHDGASWCGPCAVNRLSTEFLDAVDLSAGGFPDPLGDSAPAGPMPGSLGV